MTAADMLAEARKWLGTSGRPNPLTRAYAARNGSEYLRVAWCDIAVTEWARRSGNAAAVLPAGDRAYTVWHAQDFQRIGRWYPGTVANVNRAKPGDIVFFDWGRSNSIGAIDHVGVVEKVLGGGRVQTIEGNTGDRCLRRVRSADVIAGYGRPAYGVSGQRQEEEEEVPIRTSLGKTKPQDLAWGKWTRITWDVEHADPEGAHADGNYPGYIAPETSWADFHATVRVEGLHPGDEYQLRYEVHDWENGKSTGKPWTEIHADHPATKGVQFVTGSCSKKLKKGQHAYVAIAVFPVGDTTGRPVPKAVSGRWTIRQDKP